MRKITLSDTARQFIAARGGDLTVADKVYLVGWWRAVRGPVGSLTRPETASDFEAFDAGAGVTVHVERVLLGQAAGATIAFQFGLLGRCTAVVETAG